MIRSLIALLCVTGILHAQENRIPSPGSGTPAGATPGGVPVHPVAKPTVPFDKLPAELQAHLAQWEKKTSGMQTFYVTVEREVTKKIENKTTKYTGSIRCMKPNLAFLRIDNTAKKEDFEAFVCDGKSVYAYVSAEKTVTQYPIPPGGKGNVGDNLLLEFMSGSMTAKDVANRFNLKMIKEDQYYIYIEVLPTLPKDEREFDSLILVLYGPKVAGMEYLPAKVQMKLNNGQVVDDWTFKQPMINPANIKPADFVYIPPPKEWQVKQAAK